MKLNADKTTATKFSKARKRHSKNILKLKDQAIKFQPTTKYLGMTIDRKLNFKKHINMTAARAMKAHNTLRPLIENFNETEATKLYKIYVRPIMEYGLPALKHLPENRFHKLCTTQNKILRHITGNHRHITNEQIRKELNISSFEQRIKDLTRNYEIRKLTT